VPLGGLEPRAVPLPGGDRRTGGSKPSGWKKLTNAELDAWGTDPAVRGHAYSRPSYEPYKTSVINEHGLGMQPPDGWAVQLVSAAGMKGKGGHSNQDAFSYTVLENGWLFCVACDGHGQQGEVVSERVARMLPLFLSRHIEDSSPDDALRTAFALTQKDLELGFRTAQAYSGAAVAMFAVQLERREAWFAHAGDTRVVLGDLASGTPVFITEEHKAHEPGEHRRLRAAGAKIVERRYDCGEVVSRIFVPRTGVPGLAMSRSLGDGCLKPYGVTSEPEINNVSGLWAESESPVAVLGSDGLWDSIDVEETISLLAARRQAGLDVEQGIEALCRRAQRLWIEAEGDYCDDVTVLLVAPKSSLSRRQD